MVLLAGVVGFFTAASMWIGEFCARRLRLPIALTMPIAWAAVELFRTYLSPSVSRGTCSARRSIAISD